MENQKISVDIIQDITNLFGDIIKISKYNEALSNNVFYVKTTKVEIVLKIFSQFNRLISKDNEKDIIEYFHINGITSKLLHYTDRYFILEYIQSGPNIVDYKDLAYLLKIIHKSTIENSIHMDFKTIIETYNKNILSYQDSQFLSSFTFDLLSKIDLMNKDMAFCHNDININNLIYSTEKKLFIIDFEFACINDIYFDLASVSTFLSESRFNTFIKHYVIDNFSVEKFNLFKLLLNSISGLWYYYIYSLDIKRDKNHIYLTEAQNIVKDLQRIKL